MPIRFAANCSPYLVGMLEEGTDIAVKISDWGGLDDARAVSERFPEARFLVHLTLVMASPAPVDQAPFFDDLRELVTLTSPPFLSAHIGYNCVVGYDESGRYIFGEPLSVDAQIENTRRNVALLREAFGLDVVLENQVNVYGGGRVPEYVIGCTAPDYLTRTLDETGCEMLLDLAHARVSSAFLGMSVDDYIAGLRLDRVREIHLSGCRMVGDLLSDEHAEMVDDDYALLGRTLGQCVPEWLTLEYEADGPALERQLTRLRSIAGV